MTNFIFNSALLLMMAGTPAGWGQIHSLSDSVLYENPSQQFKWVRSPQKVEGIDLQLLAVHAHLQKPKKRKGSDTTFVQFFVPENKLVIIELSNKRSVTKLKPNDTFWDGSTQCLGLPHKILRRCYSEGSELFFLGRGQDDEVDFFVPVTWDSALPDTVASYRFWFFPNTNLNIRCGLYQQTKDGKELTVFEENMDSYYPGSAKFSIDWDGNCRGQPCPEGYYRLSITGTRYQGDAPAPSNPDISRDYVFYHRSVLPPSTCK